MEMLLESDLAWTGAGANVGAMVCIEGEGVTLEELLATGSSRIGRGIGVAVSVEFASAGFEGRGDCLVIFRTS